MTMPNPFSSTSAPVLEAIRDQHLEQQARALYSDDLPYHNFNHVLETLSAANTIVERCQVEHIRIDQQVVYLALLFHDAGYHEDHQALGHPSKETYSAALATQVLNEAGFSSAQIRKCSDAIMATHRDGDFVTTEQKAVRAADLSGMAADYPVFLESSMRLRRELEILTGNSVSWSKWQQNSRDVLGFYLSQEIRLTSFYHDKDGNSTFHSRLQDNLARLLSEPKEPQKPADS